VRRRRYAGVSERVVEVDEGSFGTREVAPVTAASEAVADGSVEVVDGGGARWTSS